jgi:pyrroline-5-carboxylate reductase
MLKAKILLVGCGKMGGALLQRAAALANIDVVDPAAPPAHLKSLPDVLWLSTLEKIDPAFTPDLVILAIKPQHMAEILPAYARFRKSAFLSIAAGQTIARLAHILGHDCAIVRAMPNLPASVGAGITVATANKNVTSNQRALCDKILNSIGITAWTEDENLLDAVTALSGSGPAYVFALTEAMAKAGENLGLAPALAAQLARQTMIGSGALLARSTESAASLRASVTSPGGTTEAALKHLLAPGGLNDLLLKAMQAAAQRARELSS